MVCDKGYILAPCLLHVTQHGGWGSQPPAACTRPLTGHVSTGSAKCRLLRVDAQHCIIAEALTGGSCQVYVMPVIHSLRLHT